MGEGLPELRQLVTGEGRDDSGESDRVAHVDAADACVRNGAPQNADVLQVVGSEIAQVLTLAGQEALVLDTPDAIPDAAQGALGDPILGLRHRPSRPSPATSAAPAASMASTMLA